MKRKTGEENVIEKLKEGGLLTSGSDVSLQYTKIPFHIDTLDELVGGGIPKKRITLLIGPTNTGKSYLASQIVASVQKEGGTAAWIDTELSWDSKWMEKCGIDLDSVLVSQPETGEAAFGVVRELMRNSVDVVVLDSLAGLVPASMHDEDFSFNPMAWQARFINGSLPRIMPYLKNGTALILINQTRSSLGPVSGDTMPGGLAQTFFAHFTLLVRRSGWIKDGDQNVGFEMEIRCRKSKVGGQPFQSCTIPFRLEGGIDLVETVVREAQRKGIIKHAGPWYSVFDEKIMGMNGVRRYLGENIEQFERLKEEVRKDLE